MIEQRVHGDVTELRFSWWRSRMVGMSVNAFLVRGVLVDTAFPAVAGDVARLLDCGVVRGAIITHHHEDHAGNAGLIATRGLPVLVGERTRPYLHAPERIAFYRRFTWKDMNAPSTSALFDERHVHASGSQPDDDRLDASLELVHAPGHSPDHHIVWDASTDTLFAGDLFLGVKVRVAHEDADARAELQTLRAMIERKPMRMFCAHRGYVEHPLDMLRAKADWTEQLIDEVERHTASGMSLTETARKLLGHPHSIHWFSRGEYSAIHLVRAIVER
jgi:glyoxylase-like metal-dependent hydrolase (beta-lactamase superfamily II)